ncbi:hypothetical protein K8I61_13545 [bacterium]|nr:hypothetical protein [bacterium]
MTLVIVFFALALSVACAGKDKRVEPGTARISPTGKIVAGTPVIWRIAYAAPKGGLAKGGAVIVLFPQDSFVHEHKNPKKLARARIDIEALPVDVGIAPHYDRYVRVTMPRAVAAGEIIDVDIGTGEGEDAPPALLAPRGAQPSFAPLILVDAAGDGHFERAASEDYAEIVAGPAVRAQIVAPSRAGVGENIRAVVRVLDAFGNLAAPAGDLNVIIRDDSGDDSYNPPPPHATGEAWANIAAGRYEKTGYRWLAASFGGALPDVTSNPIAIDDARTTRATHFGLLGAQSDAGYGALPARDLLDLAAGPAALDFVAITDPAWTLDDARWAEQKLLCRESRRLGAFIPLLAYNVAYGDMAAAIAPDCDADINRLAAGTGDPWRLAIDAPDAEPWAPASAAYFGSPSDVLEVGRQSNARVLLVLYANEDGHLVRRAQGIAAGGVYDGAERSTLKKGIERALDRGWRFGFAALGDGARAFRDLIDRPLTAVTTGAMTRRTIFAALERGRTYVTSGARILLSVDIDGKRPGDTPATAFDGKITIDAAGTAPIRSIDIHRDGSFAHRHKQAGETRAAHVEWVDKNFDRPSWYHVRVTQADGAWAVSSPIFLAHPDWARVDEFAATDFGDAVEVSFNGASGGGTKGFRLWRRFGNEADGDPRNYERIGDELYAPGETVFRDDALSTRGVVTCYLLEEVNAAGSRAIGPAVVIAKTPVRMTDDKERLVLPYDIPQTCVPRIEIADLGRGVVRTIVEPERGPGRYEVEWDMTDARGRRVETYTRYRVHCGPHAGPPVPIVVSPIRTEDVSLKGHQYPVSIPKTKKFQAAGGTK